MMKSSTKRPSDTTFCDDDSNSKEAEGTSDSIRSAKVTRHEVELPVSEADIRLAEKLDECLKISTTRRARFFMNKPKCETQSDQKQVISPAIEDLNGLSKLKPKNLSKEQLRERLISKYDSLVPELDPNRPNIKLVKILSATESLKMAEGEARKQLVEQMELNSVSGNQRAQRDGIDSFKFNDGYETHPKGFYNKKFETFRNSKSDNSKSQSTKSVKFSDQQQDKTLGSKLKQEDTGHQEVPNPCDVFLRDDEYDKLTDDDDDDGKEE